MRPAHLMRNSWLMGNQRPVMSVSGYASPRYPVNRKLGRPYVGRARPAVRAGRHPPASPRRRRLPVPSSAHRRALRCSAQRKRPPRGRTTNKKELTSFASSPQWHSTPKILYCQYYLTVLLHLFLLPYSVLSNARVRIKKKKSTKRKRNKNHCMTLSQGDQREKIRAEKLRTPVFLRGKSAIHTPYTLSRLYPRGRKVRGEDI